MKPDAEIGYPRVCSHRGFNTVMPENTIPALALAVSLGADEIEIDLWPTVDGELIVCHDDTVDRMSDGTGAVSELTCEQIMRFDVGIKHSAHLKGLKFARFEEVLEQFAKRVIINIHIKNVKAVEKTVDLIYKYDCAEYVYIAGVNDVMETSLKIAPELTRCCLDGQGDYTLVDRAIKYKCRKCQLVRGKYTAAMIEKAHAHDIKCNLFWSDYPEEVADLLKSGIDTILTNDYLSIANEVKKICQDKN
ncbi:MAG: hypothetical protein FWF15_11515 [Oscillospiraceae bacterium]|nr:hypothetical protein [Oscillospiraceae bacterium]